jgi:hypothetical protein
MAGAIIAGVAVVAVLGLQWLTGETAKEAAKNMASAASALDVEGGQKLQTQRALDRAREAIARKAFVDAIVEADAALAMTPTGMEAADAWFIKAQARVLDGDENRAEADLRRYFDLAPPHHRDFHAAKVMMERLQASSRAMTSGASPSGAIPRGFGGGAP